MLVRSVCFRKHPLLDEGLSNSFLSVLSNLHPLDSTHSSQFISPPSAWSSLLSFTSSRIPFEYFSRPSAIHYHYVSSSLPLQLFHTFRCIFHFSHTFLLFVRSLLVIPSILLSILLCEHWILLNFRKIYI
jgi:hypothetical protein